MVVTVRTKTNIIPLLGNTGLGSGISHFSARSRKYLFLEDKIMPQLSLEDFSSLGPPFLSCYVRNCPVWTRSWPCMTCFETTQPGP